MKQWYTIVRYVNYYSTASRSKLTLFYPLIVERVSRCVCNTDRKRRTEIKIGHRMQAVKRT